MLVPTIPRRFGLQIWRRRRLATASQPKNLIRFMRGLSQPPKATQSNGSTIQVPPQPPQRSSSHIEDGTASPLLDYLLLDPSPAFCKTSGPGCRFIGATGQTRGIIELCRRPCSSSSQSEFSSGIVDFEQSLCLHSVLPGIAFSLDLIETTNQYGVAEVLLSSFMAAFVFSIFGAQPLCIAGVTGK